MTAGRDNKIVVVASLGDSLVTFRGDLLRQMRQRGWRVRALAPELTEPTKNWLVEQGVEFVEAPLSRTGTSVSDDVRYLAWLYGEIAEFGPDIVLAYTVKPVVYALLASAFRRSVRRYALITGLGYAFADGSPQRKRIRNVVELLYRAALRKADLVFFQNPDDEALFRTRHLLRETTPSMVVAGSGIDVDQFSVVPLPRNHVVFILIARLLGDKGVREFVQALRIVRAKHPNVVGRLVGWIDTNPDAIQPQELEAWIAQGDVEYLGRLRDVRPAISEASVYVLPSYREGTPRTVLEAMAMGRPIITTDAPGCRETVIHGVNGLLVPVRSVVELASAMERFVVEPDLARTMGERSRERAEAKYDVRRVSATMLDAMGI
ncbi:MAG: hypothetical protein RL385_969 [Pseudomonadota bacterium]|jgi:glycosyltransferase involved in cell wall biosynthesis